MERNELINFLTWLNTEDDLKYTNKGIPFMVDMYLENFNMRADCSKCVHNNNQEMCKEAWFINKEKTNCPDYKTSVNK